MMMMMMIREDPQQICANAHTLRREWYISSDAVLYHIWTVRFVSKIPRQPN